MSGKYALIIGNTEYIDPGLAQLIAPGKDAEDLARVLKDPNICAFDNVKVLANELSSTVIEKIDEFFDQKKPDDMLVLYFSGHGVRDESGSLYLAFKNTIHSRLRSTAIKSDYVREAMDGSRSKRQVLILDCCNSGAFAQGTKAEIGGIMGLTRAFQGYGRFVLTASDATQFAWEGDKVIGSTDNSLFTHFLLKGLEGEADSDGDGNITVDELYEYAYEQVSKVTPNQTPTKSASRVAGDIVLRQIMRVEDIKLVALPNELIEATEDPRTFVREGAVQQLTRYLNGKNLGLARSAREALERIAENDDSRQVSRAAVQALELNRQADELAKQKEAEGLKKQEDEEARLIALRKAKVQQILHDRGVEAERQEKEKAEQYAAQKAEEERLAREKAESEQKTKLEAQHLAEQKAEEDRNAREEVERLATPKAEEEGLAREKVESERKVKLEEERLAAQKAEQKRLAREKFEAEQKAEEERLAREKSEAELRSQEAAQSLIVRNAKEDILTKEKVTALQEMNVIHTDIEKSQKGETKIATFSQFFTRKRILAYSFKLAVRVIVALLSGLTISYILSSTKYATFFPAFSEEEIVTIWVPIFLAGIIAYPHYWSIIFLVIGFSIAGTYGRPNSSAAAYYPAYDVWKPFYFILEGTRLGFPIGALASRILHVRSLWLKKTKDRF